MSHSPDTPSAKDTFMHEVSELAQNVEHTASEIQPQLSQVKQSTDSAATTISRETAQSRRDILEWINYFLSFDFWFMGPIYITYRVYQYFVAMLFTMPERANIWWRSLIWQYRPIPPGATPFGRVAVIGAGLTGISSAAHLVSHGFEVIIYESSDRVGGIWAFENTTSSLQLNSLMYRFHPSIKWSEYYPKQPEIMQQIETVWHKYHLEPRTRLKTEVKKVTRDSESSTNVSKGGHARWKINDGEDGIFDAVIASIGTCGPPKRIPFKGLDNFRGPVLHSSELDKANLVGKKVVIIGSGASGVEAAELAVKKKANGIVMLAREDKWIIPRWALIDIALALYPRGRETVIGRMVEWMIKTFHYRDLADMRPFKLGLYESTPVVSNEILHHIRQGLVAYVRGDTVEVTEHGVLCNLRRRETRADDPGRSHFEPADVIILATGYYRPKTDFLPADLFPVEGPRDYRPPNLYLQNFSTTDWSVMMSNTAYEDAIGTVGNWHIGILARLLMVMLINEKARPDQAAMRTWVDVMNFLGENAYTKRQRPALSFFTYTELILFFITWPLFNLSRIMWFPFILFGWGVRPDMNRRYVSR